jgi:hypothetical protein
MTRSQRSRFTSWLSRWRVPLIVTAIVFIVVAGVAVIGLAVVQGTALPPAPAGPSIQVIPREGRPGTTILVDGAGWEQGDVVSIHLQALADNQAMSPPMTTAEVAAQGTFVAAFVFPTDSVWGAQSRVLVVARSTLSDDEAFAVFTVSGVTQTPTGAPEETATPAPTPLPTATPLGTPLPTSSPTPVPPTSTPMPVQPTATPLPVIVGWRGEYFANPTLSGVPNLVRDDGDDLSFNWGTGAPAPSLPVDRFSVRWTRTIYLPGGTYRFYAYSDDGVRVWLDGALIIDEWHAATGRVYAAERTLGASNHALRVEYYEDQGVAQIQFWWERPEDFPEWRGAYYPNPNLSGAPDLVRNDRVIAFDWGSGAPAPGLPSDNFSARWTRTVVFAAGLYRFHAIVDDGVRVYVDDQLLIDEWRDGARREVTADRRLTTGYHRLRVEYYERTGEAYIAVSWEEIDEYPDWRGEYWSNRDLAGSPVLVRNDTSIAFNWGTGSPAGNIPVDNFSARWTRTAAFASGTFRFHAVVDDGVRVWVDDQLIIDGWRDGAARELTGDLALAAGDHRVRVEYYEHTGLAQIHVWWEQVSAPSFPDWKGEYFTNRFLQGTPVLVRNDAAIDFDWGTGAPAPGLPADNFSVRWSRQVDLETGTWRFYAWVDDGIRFYVDDDLALDEWHDNSAGEVYMVDLVLAAGEHTLVVEYYEHGGDALIKFWWERVGGLPTPTKPPPPPPPPLTQTPLPTNTPAPTATSTPAATEAAGPTATETPTSAPTATRTPAPTQTPAPTNTPAPTATSTPVATEAAGPTATPTSAPTPAPTQTPAPTNTPAPTATSTPVATEAAGPTATETPTSAPTATPTQTPAPTNTPAPTSTSTPVATEAAGPTATETPTQTPAPTNTPAPTSTSTPVASAVRLNEILSNPEEDWNGDGSIDAGDAWVELYNGGDSAVRIGGWALDDGVQGTRPYRIPQGTMIGPRAFIVFYRSETGVALSPEGGTVRLLGQEDGGVSLGRERVVDVVTYVPLGPDASYSLGRDGVWHADWPPSPGAPNRPSAQGQRLVVWPDCAPLLGAVCIQ